MDNSLNKQSHKSKKIKENSMNRNKKKITTKSNGNNLNLYLEYKYIDKCKK